MKFRKPSILIRPPSLLGVALLTAAISLNAASLTVIEENFDSYPGAATNLADMSNANFEHPAVVFTDDNPVDTNLVAGSGVQLVNWASHSGSNSVLLRASSEISFHLTNAMSGTKLQLDFWLNVHRDAGDRSFYVLLRGMGADYNGPLDYLAYRADRGTSKRIFNYDGVPPGTGWVDTGATHADDTWQHHRIVIDTAAMKLDLFLDDMVTPVATGLDIARTKVAVPTYLRILHEGNSADDGYILVDDVSLTAENAVSLETTFTEGFESYPARVNPDDDADPAGPWNVVENVGTAETAERAPTKVQVVDSSVVPPHSGSKCLKLEGGQMGGATIAWGAPPKQDVQITWWARVPASVKGTQATYLRFSLYAAENGGTTAGGDAALLGYGSRDGTIGDETSLTYYSGGWVDSQIDYTPDVWEEYRLETHSNQGRYSIVKNPNGPNPIKVVDEAGFIGTASVWTPIFMAAWSSSNGADHPPVYIDDITIKSLISVVPPLPLQYTVNYETDRFTNMSFITVTNLPAGKAIMDPRDSSILFSLDSAPGGIYRAAKVASGSWAVDADPIIGDLDRPSGFDMTANGTLWWTHDYGGQVMRLKSPWTSNVPEIIIANFGDTNAATADDDPIDLVVAPQSFNGSIGKPGSIVVADRGTDGDANNTLWVIDPDTTETNVVGYMNYLVYPSAATLGTANLNAVAALPASGEVVTISTDGYITAVDGNGTPRAIWSQTLWSTGVPAPNGSAIAVDPKTGRIWVADDTLKEVWSVDPTTGADRKELSFSMLNPNRPDRALDIHDPGMTFSADGNYMLLVDTSVANGGGRILVFHNEEIVAPATPFKLTAVIYTTSGVQLTWEASGASSYKVQRSASLAPADFQDISDVLTGTQFTDTNAPAGEAFYRVVVQP